METKKVQCNICPHNCNLQEGQAGICMARENRAGEIVPLNYGEVASMSVDPIEKKPLFHFKPGSQILSIGTWGCNMQCGFCQNWQLSQQKVPTRHYEPEEILDEIRERGLSSLAFTYSEPIIWYEYVYDTALLMKENNIDTVMVSNGFINQEPLLELLPYIDGFNIDLKAIDDDFYRQECNGRLEPVKNTIRKIAESEAHLEITNLVIRDKNDSIQKLEELIEFISSVDKEIPLHLSRYYPAYKYELEATDIDLLKRAYDLASEKLDYVYLGNIREMNYRNTVCPDCGRTIISRDYRIKLNIDKDKCKYCQHKIKGYF
ncbi:MAG: AmmeMemoRadiSam system radical SAM enzyme [Halarsenatibacteraceae bacterium]